ncbi:hypothetical protein B0A53_04957 [Rhodotorula sp. CCFEE 5036]|nr:hypothetical protein B0A53_04957 [Rhodotorula sp. CCFEE 5036]
MMVHHQTPPTRHGSTQAHDSQEDPHALPQWLDIAVSGDGLGLGLALWPPTPASPVSSAAVPIPISTSTPSLSSSRSPSSSSSLASSASSSVATTPVIQDDHAVSPVDLAIPSPDRMPSVSVANGPMGRLAAHTSQSQGRSTGSSPDLLANSFSAEHGRSISMPQLASSSEPRLSTDLSISRQSSRSPRSLAARTFATISRSASMRSIDRLEVSAVDPSLPTARAPTQPPKAATSAESAIPKLSAIGLTLNPITPNLSLARNAQPLCGAVLDGCYLLIGTTSGLDFLPLPEKGSLPVQHSGLKKRHETRKPLSLIKRTRFKQIVVLNERSNVLVAIAGRNDHVRVYPLDGIRAIIDKRMAEVDPLHGYPIPPAPSAKGKQRNDVPTSQPANLSANHFSAYQFPPSSEASEAGDSLPSSSTTSRPFASARGASTAPIRVSQRTGSAIAPVVRSVPTVQPKHVDEEEAAATSRALLETLNEEPPQSRSPEAAASRRRKRWTFNGAASSSAQSGSRGGTTPSPSRSTAVPSEDSTAGRSPPGLTRIEVVSVVPTYAPSRRRGSQQTLHHDFKRRSVASLRSISGANVKSPAERNAPAHPANVQSPLEYVKLARSRGARVLKAVETPRRTYLALVGGEEGDRVELFTGSKSISLSLNRTFVLPDTPRSIELQLQGDELVDIYLMYADTIFALEPSTVRVREVGVGREERRAQRQQDHHREEQERLLRESLSFGGSASDLQDGAAATIQPSQTHAFEGETAEVPDAEASSHPPTYAQPVGASASALRATVSTGANRDRRPVNDYSALQQLPLIPPVPSSILAPSWIIPPLYTDVVPDSDIAMHMGPTTDDAEPLLPPVSLLGGAALRNNGPPGLFFCSKGANASAIVTADGKSVTKTPLRWSGSHCTTRNDDDDDDGDAFARHRLELLVLSGKTTVVVKFAECGLEALPIVGGDDYPLPIEVPTRARSSVHFLASNAAGEQLFFAEVNSSSFTIKCLSGTS